MPYHEAVHRVSRTAIGAALAGGLVLLGGCGGSDDPDEAASAGSTASDTSSPAVSPTSDPASPDPSEPTTDDAGGSTSSSTGGTAPCDEVWGAGATLPRSYRGCEESGETVKADKHTCSFGGAIVEYDGRYYAQLGSTINDEGDLATSDGYQQALSACQA